MIRIQTGKILIFGVKSLSIILSILMLMFMVGDGLPDFSEMSPRETILFICFFSLFVGINFIWWKQRVAAWVIVGGSIAFWLIEVIYNASFWLHWFFLIFPLLAVMIFLSEKYPDYEFGKPSKKGSVKRK